MGMTKKKKKWEIHAETLPPPPGALLQEHLLGYVDEPGSSVVTLSFGQRGRGMISDSD